MNRQENPYKGIQGAERQEHARACLALLRRQGITVQLLTEGRIRVGPAARLTETFDVWLYQFREEIIRELQMENHPGKKIPPGAPEMARRVIEEDGSLSFTDTPVREWNGSRWTPYPKVKPHD